MKRSKRWILVLSMAGLLAVCGCGQKSEKNADKKESEIVINISGQTRETDNTENNIESGTERKTEESIETEYAAAEAAKKEGQKQEFGENCIAEQTFEVELSEYSGKVSFVPFAPSEENQDFHIQIIQEGKVLTDIQAYVPSKLAGEPFVSLDAVSFYDVNFDGNTDIVLIETYGNTNFAAVYYGLKGEEDKDTYFIAQEPLSEILSSQVKPLSVPEIRNYVANGKKNGEFSSYQEAYNVMARLCSLESAEEKRYGLIYFDEDDIPELVVGMDGYYTSLYTYKAGKLYTLMNHWPYGAMGNAGYEYSPRKNSLRNYNTDYAGAILYTSYLAVSDQYTMDTIAHIETYNFDDVNGNGILDEDEEGSLGLYGINYINGREASNEECASYDAGEYTQMRGTMTAEELRTALDF